MEYKKNGVSIIADQIEIGDNVTFGTNINVRVKGRFGIGDYSHLGNNAEIYGNNISFGKHLFNSGGLRVGGGGRLHPNANLYIGDRCTIHNNFINVCEPVIIGDDVGLSPDVSLLTHGYWQNVLEGYPATFSGITIGEGVIVGYRSVIMMGVGINCDCVIGAQSVVTKSLSRIGIYGGSPAKFIKPIIPLSYAEKHSKTINIIKEYKKIAAYHNLSPTINIDYPYIDVDDFTIDVENLVYQGKETVVTDDFRDYIRKWGIRIYTERPFKSNLKL